RDWTGPRHSRGARRLSLLALSDSTTGGFELFFGQSAIFGFPFCDSGEAVTRSERVPRRLCHPSGNAETFGLSCLEDARVHVRSDGDGEFWRRISTGHDTTMLPLVV